MARFTSHAINEVKKKKVIFKIRTYAYELYSIVVAYLWCSQLKRGQICLSIMCNAKTICERVLRDEKYNTFNGLLR